MGPERMMAQVGKNVFESHQIATLVHKNIGSIKDLTSSLAPYELRYSKAVSQLARFKLWAGSLGAHRKAGRRSLDHRLRDASSIREHVLNLLGQLEEAVGDAMLSLHDPMSSTCEAHDYLDLELVEYLKDDNESSESDLDLALADISHVIDCLLRLSITIRNPAPHDQFLSRAGAETLGYYEQYDIKHVQEKFPRMEITIAERLGRAMTSRRHFFKYREHHYTKISGGIDNDGGPAEDGDQTTVVSSVPRHHKDSLDENSPIDLDARSEISGTSYALSLDNQEELRVPPIPEEYLDGPFLCPFCYLMIEVGSRDDWKKHVFRDLQPYICLAPFCLTQDHKFSRRTDWAHHMKQTHWRALQCPYGCQQVSGSADEFECHLWEAHPDDANLQQQGTFETICSQEDPKKAIGPCPLCIEVTIKSTAHYSTHIGGHLEQLALFALPRMGNAKDENESSKDENESQSNTQRGKSSQKAMLSKALSKANTAVQLDNAQNYSAAREAYLEACELLQEALARTQGDDDREKIEAIRQTYTSRIEELDGLAPIDPHGDKVLPARPDSNNVEQVTYQPSSGSSSRIPRATHSPHRLGRAPVAPPYPDSGDSYTSTIERIRTEADQRGFEDAAENSGLRHVSQSYSDRSRSRRRSHIDVEDKMRNASRYQDNIGDGLSSALTADALRKAKTGGSSRSTRSSASRDESEYKNSATTHTARSSSGEDDITIKVSAGCVVEVENVKIHSTEGDDDKINRYFARMELDDEPRREDREDREDREESRAEGTSPAPINSPEVISAPPPTQQIPPQQQSTLHPLRFSKYNFPDLQGMSAENSSAKEPAFTTDTFKNSHFNTAHYNNPDFRPEMYHPGAQEEARTGRVDQGGVEGSTSFRESTTTQRPGSRRGDDKTTKSNTKSDPQDVDTNITIQKPSMRNARRLPPRGFGGSGSGAGGGYSSSARAAYGSGDRGDDQSKWRWNCCNCSFTNLSYNYVSSCPSCGHNRDSSCTLWMLPP
ncbi:hypothetical protein F5Y10DRAFT_103409 [Nemania abortiva]|nr:hypothetical protein F5Y10DRAFT_103409 [Nemania abortiva]